ncbi:hypothetical protein [Streptomyces sp. WAC00263]|uniref:hypothetical protein n=1 Tax=Streptomyces sp. WAC00263 TaxID=1917422 RepID=UPI0009C69763|nr:hypothetical protein [Streptomyces sp. WAC00263]KAF5994175.1 hypothetical protein BOG92_022785 [Streptomyces sp. WAC00263]
MNGIDPVPLLFFVAGWFFALNIRGLADRIYQYGSRFTPMIGGPAAFRIMGWAWIFGGGAYFVLEFLD